MRKTTCWMAGCVLALGVCGVASAQPERSDQDRTSRFQQRQDREQSDQNQRGRNQSGRDRQGRNQQSQDDDEFLQSLDLSDEQRQQIREINQKHQQQFNQLLRRFQRTHMRAVRLESALLAAVEGGMSDSEKQQFRQKMRQQRETQDVSREGAEQREALRPARDGAENGSELNRNQPDEPQSPQAQPPREDGLQADSEERQQAQAGSQRDRRQGQQERQEGFGQSERGLRGGGRQDGSQVEGVLIVIAAPDTSNAGLSPQQQQQARQISQRYQQPLRQTWRQLHALHHQMVALQSQKLQEIEEVLTEEQLREAHRLHQQGPRPGQDREGRSFDRTQPPPRDREDRESGSQRDRERENR